MSLPCPSCGFDSPEGMKFCGDCGASLTKNVCPQCRFENPPRFKFCGQCGTSLRIVVQAAPAAPAANIVPVAEPALAPRTIAEVYRVKGELLLAQEVKGQRSKVKGQR